VTTKDNRIRGIRQVVPTNTLIGRIDPGSGKPQYIDANRLRRMLGPGFVKAIAAVATPTIPDGDVLANTSGGAAAPVGTGVSALLDYVFGSAQGDILYRDAAAWKVLVPGTSGYFLQTQGAAANPLWAATTGGGPGGSDISPFSDNSITKPVAANFSIADDTSAGHGIGTIADLAHRGVELTETHGSGGPTQSWYYEAAVSNTLISMTAYISPNFTDLSQSWFYGVGVRDNTGKLHTFGIRNNAGTGNSIFADFRYTNISTLSSNVNQTGGGMLFGRPCWFRLAKVCSNFVFSVSMNGETYFTVETVSATAFVSSTLNDVGILIENNLVTNGAAVVLDCFSFVKS
jgi:hypothetical protein